MDSSLGKEKSAPTSFSLNSEDASFNSRTQDVFANLGVLEKKHSAVVKTQKPDRHLLKDDPEDEDFCGDRAKRSKSFDLRSKLSNTNDYHDRKRSRSSSSDSGRRRYIESSSPKGSFRRPRGLPSRYRSRGTPDYKKNPESWTCYSLDDVPDQDMSERANKNAALSFLEERRKEREKEERRAAGLPEEEPEFDVSYGACSQGKISFSHKKSKPNKKNEDVKDEMSTSSIKRIDVDLPNDDNDEYSISENVDRSKKDDKEIDMKFKFKSKKNVNRNIRKKESSDDSDG